VRFSSSEEQIQFNFDQLQQEMEIQMDVRPSASSILKSHPWVREYLEVVFDTAPAEARVTGFICKVCWEQFDIQRLDLTVLGHVERHRSRQQKPYQSRRRLSCPAKIFLRRVMLS
jgi:hypothetical protein